MNGGTTCTTIPFSFACVWLDLPKIIAILRLGCIHPLENYTGFLKKNSLKVKKNRPFIRLKRNLPSSKSIGFQGAVGFRSKFAGVSPVQTSNLGPRENLPTATSSFGSDGGCFTPSYTTPWKPTIFEPSPPPKTMDGALWGFPDFPCKTFGRWLQGLLETSIAPSCKKYH